MAHFAKIENNTVEQVIVIANDDCGGGNFPESESIGQAFIASLGISGEWLQCSYHANFRSYWPNPGFTFDADAGEYGEFVPMPFTPFIEP